MWHIFQVAVMVAVGGTLIVSDATPNRLLVGLISYGCAFGATAGLRWVLDRSGRSAGRARQ